MTTADELAQPVVAVNGGGRGIGAAVCAYFAQHGAHVAVLDVDEEAAERTAAEARANGVAAVAIKCDVALENDIERAFDVVDRQLGPLAVLVNNAGINPRQLPLDVQLDTWNRVLAVNLTGYFLSARAAARRMMRSGGGAIVNVSSIAGSTALGRGNLAYAVSKGGVDALTRELAVEWACHGIRVNAVAPCQVATAGFVENEAARQATDDTAADYRRGIPLGRLADPTEIAAAVYYLASPAAAMITGVVLPVDGGNLAMNAGGTIGRILGTRGDDRSGR